MPASASSNWMTVVLGAVNWAPKVGFKSVMVNDTVPVTFVLCSNGTGIVSSVSPGLKVSVPRVIV